MFRSSSADLSFGSGNDGFRVIKLVKKGINRADAAAVADAEAEYKVYEADAYERKLEDEDQFAKAGMMTGGDRIAFLTSEFERSCNEGDKLYSDGDFAQALVKFREALETDEVPAGHIAYAYCQMGACYLAMKKFEPAEAVYDCYLQIANLLQDKTMQCTAMSHLGVVYYHTKRYRDALAIHTKSLHLAEAYPLDNRMLLASFANIGNLYAATGKFEAAVELHSQQLRIARILEDQDAIARAAFNLENDHNSLKQSAIAESYKRQKLGRSQGYLNDGLGDTFNEEVYSGWLSRHRGGAEDGPTELSKAKVWCVLSNSVLAYHKDTRSALPARCIKIEEVKDVAPFANSDTSTQPYLPTYSSDSTNHKSGAQVPKYTFKLETAARCFYFSADSEEEAGAWIDAIHRGRTAKNKFGTLDRSKWGKHGKAKFTSLDDSAALFNDETDQPVFVSEDDTSLNMAGTFDPLHNADVQNPLFDPDLDAIDEDEVVTGTITSPSTYARDVAPSTVRTAWGITSHESELLKINVFLLGKSTVETGSPPAVHEAQYALEILEENSITSEQERFALSIVEGALIVEKGKPSLMQTSNRIPLDSVAGALSIDDTLIIIEYNIDGDGQYDLTFYRAGMAEKASKFKQSVANAIHDHRHGYSHDITATLSIPGSPQDEPEEMIGGVRKIRLNDLSDSDSRIDGVTFVESPRTRSSTVDGLTLDDSVIGRESTPDALKTLEVRSPPREYTDEDIVTLNLMRSPEQEYSTDSIPATPVTVQKDKSEDGTHSVSITRGVSGFGVSLNHPPGKENLDGSGGTYITELTPGGAAEKAITHQLGLTALDALRVVSVNDHDTTSAKLVDIGRYMTMKPTADVILKEDRKGFGSVLMERVLAERFEARLSGPQVSFLPYPEEYIEVEDNENVEYVDDSSDNVSSQGTVKTGLKRNSALRESLKRAEDAAAAAGGYIHPAQVDVDEGSEERLPTWREKQLQDKKSVSDEPIYAEGTPAANRHSRKRESEAAAAAKGQEILSLIENIESPTLEIDTESAHGTEDNVIEVSITRGSQGFGMVVNNAFEGGDSTLYVTEIRPNSSAEKSMVALGLSPANGLQILSANEVDLTNATKHECVDVIKNASEVKLMLRQVGTENIPAVLQSKIKIHRTSDSDQDDVVSVTVHPNANGYGMVINSVTEGNKSESYITELKPGSAAAAALSAIGLSTLNGLQILSINGVDLSNATKYGCINVMKAASYVKFELKKLAMEKIPPFIVAEQHFARTKASRTPSGPSSVRQEPSLSRPGSEVDTADEANFQNEVMRLWAQGSSQK